MDKAEIKKRHAAKKGEPKSEPNAWTKHVMEVRKANPGKCMKDCMVLAKESYKK
jgi:hypothetical protein